MITPSQHHELATDKLALKQLEECIDQQLLQTPLDSLGRVVVYPPKKPAVTTSLKEKVTAMYRSAGWEVKEMTDVRGNDWWWEFRR